MHLSDFLDGIRRSNCQILLLQVPVQLALELLLPPSPPGQKLVVEGACGSVRHACRQDIDVQRKEIAEEVKRSLDMAPDDEDVDDDAMLISRKWLMNWKQRQCKLSYLSECTSPTGSITCHHGRLLPTKGCAASGPCMQCTAARCARESAALLSRSMHAVCSDAVRARVSCIALCARLRASPCAASRLVARVLPVAPWAMVQLPSWRVCVPAT